MQSELSVNLVFSVLSVLIPTLAIVISFSRLRDDKSHEIEKKAKGEGKSTAILENIQIEVRRIGVKLDENHDVAIKALNQAEQAMESAERAHDRIDMMKYDGAKGEKIK